MNDIRLFFSREMLSFPQVSTYITHLTGGKVENSKVLVNRTTLYMRSIGFIIGLSNIFADGRIA